MIPSDSRPPPAAPSKRPSAALRLAAIYAALGGLWILVSDRVLELAVGDPHRAAQLQTLKGWGYVLVTTALLYGLARRHDAVQHRSSERVRRSERTLHTLLSNLPGMAYKCRNDREWTLEFASEGCFALTGHPAADLAEGGAPSYAELIHEQDRSFVWDEVQRAVDADRPFRIAYRIVKRSGETRWVWEQGRAVDTAADGTRILEGFITDITERKTLEEQLRVSRKLDAMGKLAGGLVHDFNNLLTVISGYAEILGERTREDPSCRRAIDEIRKAGNRGTRLTRQLLAFGRAQVLEPRALDLNDVVTEMQTLFSRLLGEDVEVRTELAPGLGVVKADPSQMEQVLMNLALNARHAMKDGGRLTLATSNVELREDEALRRADVRPGPYVMLSVADTGCGMDSATRSRIFEPFFTTKRRGEGAGLGLATAYGIVRQSNGYIELDSEPGRGALFRIYLPRVDSGAAGADLLAVSGSETVLLVEEDDLIREPVSEYLSAKGYRVLTAATGERALEIARDDDGIDVLVTDPTISGSGRELASHLSSSRPDLEVLFLSYHGEADLERRGLLRPGEEFLQKPFPMRLLAATIRRLLDGVDGASTSPVRTRLRGTAPPPTSGGPAEFR